MQIIPIDQIEVKGGRQREHFPEQEMLELQNSIFDTSMGLLSPILVRPGRKGERTYVLVAGERRLRAIVEGRRPYIFADEEIPVGHIPAVVRAFETDIEAEEAELHENVVRLNLTWQEKARAIARLHEYKKRKDDRHTEGMTAKLIDTSSEEKDYAGAQAYRDVNSALLVKDYLDDPAVAAAKSLHEANKIVSRKLEEESLARLREMAKGRSQVAEAPAAPVPSDDLPDLPPAPPAPTPEPQPSGTLLIGDVRERIKEIQDESVQVVVTDPPYGIGAHKFNDGGSASSMSTRHHYEDEESLDLQREVIQELDRICAASAHVYLFCDLDYFVVLKSFFSDEWRVRRTPLIWKKGVSGKVSDGGTNGYSRTFEAILVASRGKRPFSGVTPDILDIPAVRRKLHAAEKPVALYTKLLGMSAIPGDTILDCFAGSGVIFPAARETLTEPIGIELSEEYAQLCQMQMEKRSVEAVREKLHHEG